MPPDDDHVSSKRGCGSCGASYDEEAWGGLQLIQSVEPEEVRRLVWGWPEGSRVEVRRYAAGRSYLVFGERSS